MAFLPFEDNLVALHAWPRYLVAPAHRQIAVPVWGQTKGSVLGDVQHMSVRCILAGDHLVGFWEFDPGRSFSLDTDDSLRERSRFVRELAAVLCKRRAKA